MRRHPPQRRGRTADRATAGTRRRGRARGPGSAAPARPASGSRRARSSRTSRRHSDAAAISSGSPIPTTENAAPTTSNSTAGSASSVTGSVCARYATACPRAQQPAIELERGDHERPSTDTSPERAQHLHDVGRVGAGVDAAHDLARRRALGVEVVAAGRHHRADRARCPSAATSAAARSWRNGDRTGPGARVERVAAVAGDVDRAGRRSSPAPSRGSCAARRCRWSCGRRARRCRARSPDRRRCTARAARSGSASAGERRPSTPATVGLVAERVALRAPDLDVVARPPPTITMSPSARSNDDALDRAL